MIDKELLVIIDAQIRLTLNTSGLRLFKEISKLHPYISVNRANHTKFELITMLLGHSLQVDTRKVLKCIEILQTYLTPWVKY